MVSGVEGEGCELLPFMSPGRVAFPVLSAWDVLTAFLCLTDLLLDSPLVSSSWKSMPLLHTIMASAQSSYGIGTLLYFRSLCSDSHMILRKSSWDVSNYISKMGREGSQSLCSIKSSLRYQCLVPSKRSVDM